MDTAFRGGLLDYTVRLAILRGLRAHGRILDYGASWGYGVYQFRAAGYDASGFEISEPRAAFGRGNLGVTIETASGAFPDGSFDIIHTSHVLEHIPDLHLPFTEFSRLLKADGILVVFVPNAGGKFACEQGVKWGPLINEKHVLALTADFFARGLPEFGFEPLFASSPYSEPARPLSAELALEGEELLVVARRRCGANDQ